MFRKVLCPLATWIKKWKRGLLEKNRNTDGVIFFLVHAQRNVYLLPNDKLRKNLPSGHLRCMLSQKYPFLEVEPPLGNECIKTMLLPLHWAAASEMVLFSGTRSVWFYISGIHQSANTPKYSVKAVCVMVFCMGSYATHLICSWWVKNMQSDYDLASCCRSGGFLGLD